MTQTEFIHTLKKLSLPALTQERILSIAAELSTKKRKAFYEKLEKFSTEYTKHLRVIATYLEKAEQKIHAGEKRLRTSKEVKERENEVQAAEKLLNL